MATRITWEPGSGPFDYFDLRSAESPTDTFQLEAVVVATKPGPGWDDAAQRFYYDDPDGTDNTVYRIKGIYDGGVVFDSGLVQPEASKTALLQTKVRLDHHTGYPNAYQYVGPNGQPIEGGVVRVFNKPDWDAGRRTLALAITQTDAQGQWVAPAWVPPGMTYTLVFAKEGLFGPDVVEVAV